MLSRLLEALSRWARGGPGAAPPPPDSPAGRRLQRAAAAVRERAAARGSLWSDDATALVPSGHGLVVFHRVSGLDSTFGTELIAITDEAAAPPRTGQRLRTARPPVPLAHGERRAVSLAPGGYWAQVGVYPWSLEGSAPLHLLVRASTSLHVQVGLTPGRWATPDSLRSPVEPLWELRLCAQPPAAAWDG